MNQNNELYHYGILGMKWGVRRYQNKDGTLTAAGRKRAAKLKNEYTELTGKKLIRKPSSKESNSSNQNKEKSIKELSDTELREKINRLQMEKQAHQLKGDLAGKGEKFVSTVSKQVIAPAAVDAGKRVLTDLFVKIGKDKLKLNPENTKDVLSDLKKEVQELELNVRKDRAQSYFDKKNNSNKKH